MFTPVQTRQTMQLLHADSIVIIRFNACSPLFSGWIYITCSEILQDPLL